MSLEIALAQAHTGASLAWDENYERSVDRLAALGMCSSLGAALYGVRHANRARDYVFARIALGNHIKSRVKRLHLENCRKVADQVLTEWLVDFCLHCINTGEVSNEKGVRVECPVCEGSRIRVWTDRDRYKAIGLEKRFNAMVDEAIAAGWHCLTDEYISTGRTLRRQLER